MSSIGLGALARRLRNAGYTHWRQLWRPSDYTVHKTVELSGVVRSTANGLGVGAGAVVKFTLSKDSHISYEDVTIADSTWGFPAVYVGLYDIEVTMAGFQPYVALQQNIYEDVLAGQFIIDIDPV